MDRAYVFDRYPWLAAHEQPELVITGADLDSALSAALYLSRNPAARLAGFYSGSTVVHHAADVPANDLLKAVWLDLDICHRKCRSLGHGIVRLTQADSLPGLAAACNPNELAGRSVETDFWRQYPLGSAHFLMWLYEVEIPDGCAPLIWLAGSAYIHGQSSHYKYYRDLETGTLKLAPRQGSFENTEAWLRDELPLASLAESLPDLDDIGFEWRMTETMSRLSAAGFQRGEGPLASRHLQLHGFQGLPPNDDVAGHMLRLIDWVSHETGWSILPEQVRGLDQTRQRTAARAEAEVSHIQQTGGLDHFLEENKVFSYAFPNRHSLAYTASA